MLTGKDGLATWTSDLLRTPPPCADDDDEVEVASPLPRIHDLRMAFPPQPGLGVCEADEDEVSEDIGGAVVVKGDKVVAAPPPPIEPFTTVAWCN